MLCMTIFAMAIRGLVYLILVASASTQTFISLRDRARTRAFESSQRAVVRWNELLSPHKYFENMTSQSAAGSAFAETMGHRRAALRFQFPCLHVTLLQSLREVPGLEAASTARVSQPSVLGIPFGADGKNTCRTSKSSWLE